MTAAPHGRLGVRLEHPGPDGAAGGRRARPRRRCAPPRRARPGRRRPRAAPRPSGPARRRRPGRAPPPAPAGPPRAPAPGRTPGRRCAGPPTAPGPRRRRPARTTSRGEAQQRAPERAAHRGHAGQRAGPAPAGQPEQHRLGLVVEGVAEQDGAPAVASSAASRAVAGAAASPRRPPTSTATHGGGQAEAGALPGRACGDLAPSRPAARGRRRRAPLPGRTRPARRPAPGSRRRRRPRPAPARRRQVGEGPAHGDAHGGERGGRPGHARPGLRSGGRGAVQPADPCSGWRISSRVGSVSGDSQTRLNPAIPTAPTRADEGGALGVLQRLEVQAEQPAQQPVERAAAAARGAPGSARGSARRSGRPPGPTPSITCSAWPSSRDMKAVTRSSTTRCSGVCSSSTSDRRAAAGAPALSRAEQPRRVVEVGRVEQRVDLGAHVPVQPRHGGELGAVGHLVQRDPEPEVARVDAEPPLGLDDVGRDQEQPAGGRPRAERLVLPEDLARQPGEQPPICTPAILPVTAGGDPVRAALRRAAARPAARARR